MRKETGKPSRKHHPKLIRILTHKLRLRGVDIDRDQVAAVLDTLGDGLIQLMEEGYYPALPNVGTCKVRWQRYRANREEESKAGAFVFHIRPHPEMNRRVRAVFGDPAFPKEDAAEAILRYGRKRARIAKRKGIQLSEDDA